MMAVVFPAAGGPISRTKAAQAFKRVKLLANQGRYRDAGRLCLRLIKRTKPNPVLNNFMFKLYWKLGDKKKAVRCLKAALKLDPRNKYARKTYIALRRKVKAAQAS